mgnify:CR=1 FL=1
MYKAVTRQVTLNKLLDEHVVSRFERLKSIRFLCAKRALHLRGLIEMRRVDMQSAVKDLLAAADGYSAVASIPGSAQVNDSLGTVYAALGLTVGLVKQGEVLP